MYKTVPINYCKKSVLRDCMSMCFDICTINIRVSIRGAASVFFPGGVNMGNVIFLGGGLEHFYFSIYWETILPFDSYFSEG